MSYKKKVRPLIVLENSNESQGFLLLLPQAAPFCPRREFLQKVVGDLWAKLEIPQNENCLVAAVKYSQQIIAENFSNYSIWAMALILS